jgi:ATP-dependent exoDNAse (exonuclease V) beta subunit
VAVLFRKFTNAHVYLEAMHRRNIPYLTDGERHFYRRQEVIDLVNVLRVLTDPTDAIAIVGVLRSSLGGVPDQDIMELVWISVGLTRGMNGTVRENRWSKYSLSSWLPYTFKPIAYPFLNSLTDCWPNFLLSS